MLIGLIKYKEKIVSIISVEQKPKINFIIPRFYQLLESLKSADIYIFPKGEIENYYTQTALDYLNFTDKDKNSSFHSEREYILSSNDNVKLEENYKELIPILKASVPQIKVDLSRHLKYQVVEWIQTVQRAISKGDITEIEGLKTNAKIDYKLFSQIVQVESLKIEDDKRFICKIKINKSLTNTEKEIEFNEKTIPHDFEFQI